MTLPKDLKPVLRETAADGWTWDVGGHRVKLRHPEVHGVLTIAPNSKAVHAPANIRAAIARSRRLGRAAP